MSVADVSATVTPNATENNALNCGVAAVALVADMGEHPSGRAAGLLDAVETYLNRFVSYPSEHARVAHVAWIAHTWFMDHWDTTPRLAFMSPEVASGKTRALEVTGPLVPRTIFSVNSTPAYIYRKLADPNGLPTILYDEIDTVFGPYAKGNEELRGVLNSGYRRGATAGRCVTVNNTVTTEELPSFCAVALAGLSDLPDSVSTRAVMIRMRPRASGERVEPWRERVNGPEGRELGERLRVWAESVGEPRLPDTLPPGVVDRAADVWEPLIAVASLAGDRWAQRIREAAVSFTTATEQPQSKGVKLLSDLRAIFGDRSQMLTADIITELAGLPESEWRYYSAGGAVTDRQLAKLLKPYGVRSRDIRHGGKGMKGYYADDLADPWGRYLSHTSATSATSATPQVNSTISVADDVGVADSERDEKPKPRKCKTEWCDNDAYVRGLCEGCADLESGRLLCARVAAEDAAKAAIQLEI